MIKSNLKVAISKDLTEELTKSLEELASKTVCIGIPEEENVQREEGITNAQLLHLHTHGVRDEEMRKAMQKDLDGDMPYSKAHELYVHEHGSPLHQVPPRPVLLPSLEYNKEYIAELMKDALVNVLDGKDAKQELSKVGIEGQNIAKDWFTSPNNNWAPNAESTIKAKDSDRPLIDTGELRKSISFVIKDGDNK